MAKVQLILPISHFGIVYSREHQSNYTNELIFLNQCCLSGVGGAEYSKETNRNLSEVFLSFFFLFLELAMLLSFVYFVIKFLNDSKSTSSEQPTRIECPPGSLPSSEQPHTPLFAGLQRSTAHGFRYLKSVLSDPVKLKSTGKSSF